MLYDGRHEAMDEDFKDELIALIEHLLKPKNLVHKKVNRHSFDGAEFFDYLEDLFRIFQQNNLPKVETIFESTVDRQMTQLVNLCLENYKTLVKKDRNAVTNLSMIKILHDKCEIQAFLMYNKSNKMGNSNHDTKYKEMLKTAINKEFNKWKREKEVFFRELEMIRVEQERIQEEEMVKIRAEKKAAQERLERERQRKEEALRRERILREKELEKARQREAERQREVEIALETERRNNQMRFQQLILESEAERNRFRRQEQNTITTYFKCNSCNLIVEYSDLHRYSSLHHDFRVCDPIEGLFNHFGNFDFLRIIRRMLDDD